MDVLSHAKFFDHLVELVPAKYYLPAESEPVNLKYLKKSARDEAKAAFKQQYKQNKRAKLDPDQAKTTLQLQKQQGQSKAAVGAAESDTDADNEGTQEANGAGAGKAVQEGPGSHPSAVRLSLPANGKPASREELRQKLQQKLELFRKQRKAEEQQEKVEAAKQWRDKKLEKGRKAAQEKQKLQRAKQQSRQDAAQQAGHGTAQQPGQKQQQRKRGRGEGGLNFSKVDFGADDGGKGGRGSKRRKPTKAELLAAAEAKQSQVAELASTQEGKAALQKDAWGAVLARASGQKVLDDPRLLRRSMKKEAKLKSKKAAAWQERTAKQKEQQQAKQDKRKDNIDSRIKARQDKRKAQREKKLLRAGFEGRKQGFISTAKAS